MNITTKLAIKSFVEASATNPMHIWFSDFKTAKAYGARNLRGQKITEGEAKGTEVHAYYYDTLGNAVALCKDGFVRQY